MLEGGQPDRPEIMVITCGTGVLEKEVLAGIEEEGVPSILEEVDGPCSAAELAQRAAERSSLGVGVGVDADGGICVHHEKLREPLTALTSMEQSDRGTARRMGHNAARIVVGVPLQASEVFPQ